MFRAFSLWAAIAAFALAILGSWVRINGAGLTCPDWPLCQGRLVPPLDGAVLLEWSHRAVALLEALLVTGALVTGWRARSEVAFVRPVVAFIACTFAVQVALGGATVELANSPASVVLHWAAGMLFLAGLTTLALLAVVRPAPARAAAPAGGLRALLAACALLAFTAMCAGAYVSSSGAGLACATFPGCEGGWLGTSHAQAAQMVHRFIAAAFFAAATAAAYWAALAAGPRTRAATLVGYALVVLQIVLGVANVVWALPLGLREAHAANASAAFLAFVAAVIFATLEGERPAAAERRFAATAPSRP